MFGFRFIKFQPHLHVFKYKKGKIVKEGRGLSFYYYVPNTNLVAVPVSSQEVPFIFSVSTRDFQTLTVQGQVTYRIQEPRKVAELLNFTLDSRGEEYVSDDPQKLSQRIINSIQVMTNKEMGALSLKDALAFSEALTQNLLKSLLASPEVAALGLEISGIAVLALQPNPDTSRALEAETRESILKQGDDAVYSRRNSALEQERKIRENELNTQIAVEVKNRQIKETQLEADQMVQSKKQALEETAKLFQIEIEKKNHELVELESKNQKIRSDAKAYEMSAILKALETAPVPVIQLLANTGMSSERLIALAFQGIADKAEKIGNLNISPELLAQIIKPKG